MEFVLESLRADWEALLRFAPRLLYAVAVLAVFLAVGTFFGRLTARVLRRSTRLRIHERFLQRAVTWAIAAVGILLALGLMGFQGVATSMLATGGVVAIVLGFAFREIGENLLAGLFLTFSRPFEVGDLIKSGDCTGTVRSIDLRHVHVRTLDACDVFVPNAQIFRDPVHNYTRDGLRRPSFTVGVAYHDDPERVIELLQRTTAGIGNVLRDPAPFVTVDEFAANVVVYKVFYWLDVTKSTRMHLAVDTDVRVACWRALRDAGLTFSTDVTTALEIRSAPPLAVQLGEPRT